MSLSPRLLNRALRASGDRPDAVGQLLGGLGWDDVVASPFKTRAAKIAIEARAAAQPRAVVLLDAVAEASRPASVSYSREVPYLVLWRKDSLALHQAHRWDSYPGDAPLLEVDSSDLEAAADLFELLRREDVLNDVPATLAEKGREHEDLPRTLARSLVELRLRVAEDEAYAGGKGTELDSEVLRLFHQLLYMRITEDARRAKPPASIEDFMGSDNCGSELAAVLEWYAQELDSELFEPVKLSVAGLPGKVLGTVLTTLVEPWRALRLDFSVTQAELAGRLYESYLGELPAIKEDDDDLQLFNTVTQLDRRGAQASFYTPPGLASMVVSRALGCYVAKGSPKPLTITIVDPACGSGAFLVSAYRWLLDYAQRFHGRTLRPAEREALLLECIFGADIDARALRLTQVQLLEEADLRGRLPKLSENLIEGDALPAPPNVEPSGNAVDWAGLVERVGGFSAVVMNPPFESQAKQGVLVDPEMLHALKSTYPEVAGFGGDYSYLFGALALRLLRPEGTVGMVLPQALVDKESGAALRGLLGERGVDWVADFRAAKLFSGAKAAVCAVVSAPSQRGTAELVATLDSRENPIRVLDDVGRGESSTSVSVRVPRKELISDASSGWSWFRLRWRGELSNELGAPTAPLVGPEMPYRDATWGTKPASKRLVLGAEEWSITPSGAVQLSDGEELPAWYAPPFVMASDIHPWHLRPVGRRVLYPYDEDGSFTENGAVLRALERRGGKPKHYQRGNVRTLRGPKLLLRSFAREPAVVADISGSLVPTMRAAVAIRMDDVVPDRLPAMEALLNSAFYQWLLRGLGAPRHDETVEFTVSDVKPLPMPELNTAALDVLADYSKQLREILSNEDRLVRAREYRQVRHELDRFVFDLLAMSSRLRATVLEELVREA